MIPSSQVSFFYFTRFRPLRPVGIFQIFPDFPNLEKIGKNIVEKQVKRWYDL